VCCPTEMGEWHDELLILSKGTAKSTGKDGSHTTFEAGAFWGEMEFLGLRQQRTLTVVKRSNRVTRSKAYCMQT
jgi:hypothetical protein